MVSENEKSKLATHITRVVPVTSGRRLLVLWMMWAIIGVLVMSHLNWGNFDREPISSADRFQAGFTNIQHMEPDSITMEDLSTPTLLEDVNLSLPIKKGAYSIYHTHKESPFSIVTSNTSGKLSGFHHYSSGGGGSGGAGGFTIHEDTIINLVVVGKGIVVVCNSTISHQLQFDDEFQGNVDQDPITFNIIVPGDTNEKIYDTKLTVDLSGTSYDVIIYDLYFNTLYNGENLLGRNVIEYEDMGTHINIVVIKSEDNDQNIELHTNKYVSLDKDKERLKLRLFIGLTSFVLLCTSIIFLLSRRHRKAISKTIEP